MTTVLIVDDDIAIRTTVRAILEMYGYEVCGEAADGRLAIEHLLAHSQRHIILLDLEMPRMTGAQTLELLACEPLAAWSHSSIVMSGNLGRLPPAFADVPALSKPFDIDDLLAYVEAEARRVPASQETTCAIQREAVRNRDVPPRLSAESHDEWPCCQPYWPPRNL
jgi:CheY-like chemotaxis protein